MAEVATKIGMTGIDPRRIYSVVQAAHAAAVSETKLRQAIRASELPAHALGPRSTRIKGADLQTWFDAHLLKSEPTPFLETMVGGSGGNQITVQKSAFASTLPRTSR